MTAAGVAEESRPPLHGNCAGFRGHTPPGVCVVEATYTATAAATAAASKPRVSCPVGASGGSDGSGKSREDFTGSPARSRGGAAAVPPAQAPAPLSSQGEAGGTGGAPPREVKLRVCTPTGDGGTSDLSLWITLRNLEEGEEEERRAVAAAAAEGGARPYSSLSPAAVAAGHVTAGAGGGKFSTSSASDEEPVSLGGGPAESGSEGVQEKEAGEEEEEEGAGDDETVGALSSEDLEGGIEESFSDTAPLLAATNSTDGSTGEDQTRGGKGAGAIRIAVASASTSTAAAAAAAAKRGAGEEGVYRPSVDWCDVGPVTEGAGGGVVGLWRSLSQALCGVLNFCHPHPSGEGGRVGANRCR